MYRNKTATLDDVMLVGPKKMVGYKLIEDLENLAKADPVALEKKLQDMGLKTLILKGDDCAMRSGALYAYDETALTAFLTEHSETLKAHGWPVSAEQYVRRLATDWAPAKTALFDLIADTFGDHDNPGRTDYKPPQQGQSPSP